ncbi:MAG: acetylxylan esterase [Spirochaetota bacterium]
MNKQNSVIRPNDFRESSSLYEISCEAGKENLKKLLELYPERDQWEKRAESVKGGILKTARLYPLPEKTALKPRIRNRKSGPGYSVYNVAFESYPGFYCFGNLYMPEKNSPGCGLWPAMLHPHGHFDREGGRFSPMVQAGSATLARMGVIVFTYDMVGWGESLQVSHTDDYVFTYQLWNSLRSVDFLLSLGKVDRKRIGITGASGGGTQAFMAAAVDGRLALSVPVVMVSAHFYGGCHCESDLPVHSKTGTNNVEIAALTAPRPQLLVSAGSDFTQNTPRIEYPYLQRIYELYGKSGNIENVHFWDGKHDYNLKKRTAMYRFVAKHFGLKLLKLAGASGDLQEEVEIFSETELRITANACTDIKLYPASEKLRKELLQSESRPDVI